MTKFDKLNLIAEARKAFDRLLPETRATYTEAARSFLKGIGRYPQNEHGEAVIYLLANSLCHLTVAENIEKFAKEKTARYGL